MAVAQAHRIVRTVKVKHRYEVLVHLEERFWRWAYSPRQAAWLVYLELQGRGMELSFTACLRGWRIVEA